MSPPRSSTRLPPASMCLTMFRLAQASAAGERSTAITVASGRAAEMPSAIAPLPAHRSMTTGSLIAAMAFNAQSSSDSVSGRGMNTPGPTASWARPNCTDPMRCCSGMRSARLATKAWYVLTQVSSTSGVMPSRVRCTPSRWAASSSASTPGLGTPAPARVVVAARIAPRRDTRAISARPCRWPAARCGPPARARPAPRPGRRPTPRRGCRPCSRPGDRRSGSPGSCRCVPARTGRPS